MRSIRAFTGMCIAASCGLAAFAGPATAAITVDDWSVDQGPFRQTGTSGISDNAYGSMLGGRREFQGSNGENKSGGGYTAEVSGGRAYGTFDPGYFALVQFSWGDYSSSMDLTQGGVNDRFRLDSVLAPGFILSGYILSEGASLLFEVESNVNATNYEVSFESFSYFNPSTFEFRAATAADFAHVSRISLQTRTDFGEYGDSQAFEFGRLSIVPAPSAAGLLAVGGLAAVRRRR